jgi:cellulose synthase/poly-beta-1,6-N-acetylglucosamine synthase-like glycosyltransferase
MIQYSSINDAWGHSNKEIYKKNINNNISDTENIDYTTVVKEPIKIEQKEPIKIEQKEPIKIEQKEPIKIEQNEEMTNTCDKFSNEMIIHIRSCEKCRNKFKSFENDNVKLNLNGIEININRNILKIIFLILIFIILLIIISLFKNNNNNKYNKYYSSKDSLMHNDMYLEPYLRQMLYNIIINKK